ncbi:TetR/AcrR family transcriptional regulator [Nocardia sp. NPDC059177]|uniref:TetR/AcrR family transcriptional regulator n=1 Tax=Nocardia sp. NPDC059177 TaxID=3346759 RepID=UPI00367C8DBC
MRRHGWSGTVPGTDAEAVDRILTAARAVIERSGAAFTMAEIARELGVTRQTVYRYFPNADALITATALAETGRFLDVLAAELDRITDPAEAVVEGIAYTLETLPEDRYLSLLLMPGRASAFPAEVTSDTALALGRSILERFAVDWDQAGITGSRLDELVEHMLRVVASFVLDPGRPPRRGTELRAYLTTWVAPAVRGLQRR